MGFVLTLRDLFHFSKGIPWELEAQRGAVCDFSFSEKSLELSEWGREANWVCGHV